MKKQLINLFILAFAIFSLTAPTFAADYIDTQYGPDGIEVHLLKVSQANNILTIAFMLENTTVAEVRFVSMAIDNALYTTADTKYTVLKDADDKYLASTISYADKNSSDEGYIFAALPKETKRLSLEDGSKKVGWIKFEAPKEEDWPIEVSLPGVTPFTIEKP